MIPEDGIDILGQAIEQTLIKLIALNSITFIAGAMFGFLAGRGGGGRNARKRTSNKRRSRSSASGSGRNTPVRASDKNVLDRKKDREHHPRDREACRQVEK